MRRPGGLVILLLAVTGCGGPESTGTPRSEEKKPGVIEIEGLTSQVPAGWTAEPPTNEFRMAQFRLSGDAEVVVYHRISGSPKENVARWKSFFTKIEREAPIATFTVGHLDMAVFDASGTYQNAMNPRLRGKAYENYRQVAVYITGKQAAFQVILTGPAEAVERHKADFDAWLKGFK